MWCLLSLKGISRDIHFLVLIFSAIRGNVHNIAACRSFKAGPGRLFCALGRGTACKTDDECSQNEAARSRSCFFCEEHTLYFLHRNLPLFSRLLQVAVANKVSCETFQTHERSCRSSLILFLEGSKFKFLATLPQKANSGHFPRPADKILHICFCKLLFTYLGRGAQ